MNLQLHLKNLAVFFAAGLISCQTGFSDVTVKREDVKNVGVVEIYRMTVTPAPEPIPAFKYRLTIEPHKTVAGNAITHYLRSLGENSLNSPWDTARKKFGMDVHEWYQLETKSQDIPVEKLREAASYFDGYVEHHLRRATMCRECEWGLAFEDLRGPATIEFLLPSIQQTRSMARALMLRNRLAVLDGRFEDSVDHLRMTYQLGQNVSKLEVLVANLVGIAEIGMANEGMTDLISAKGSPNMYWALSELPNPIVSIRDAIRLETSFATRYFPELLDIETAQHSPEQWTEILSKLIAGLETVHASMRGSASGDHKLSLRIKMFAAGAGVAAYPGCKKRLIAGGMDKEEVEQLAVAHVILLDISRDFQSIANDHEKAYYLPYPRFQSYQSQLDDRLRQATPLRPGMMLADAFLPAILQVRQAEVRVQAGVNILIAIEAIRNHIATNGSFPASLDEMSLPTRNNPFTDKPYPYSIKGDTAILEMNSGYARKRFEIKIAK